MDLLVLAESDVVLDDASKSLVDVAFLLLLEYLLFVREVGASDLLK
jgi:hypothetical protein